ncbi:MAG: cellulase [Curvibacter sp.]|nr:cellulase [Curvibacter sp.]
MSLPPFALPRPAQPPRSRAAGSLSRRALLGQAAFGFLASAAQAAPQVRTVGCAAADWPLWNSFYERFGTDDGRIIDFSVPQMHTTSEGQSYAMLFALVADQPERFERLWRWSVANLAGGNIASRLPAWQWGQLKDGSWGVIDNNPASDADLWFAYTLLEAARVWKKPAYEADARTLLARIVQDEVVDLPGLGKMLLPGPVGFSFPEQKLWRLNPSYLPLPLLRRFTQADPHGPWAQIAGNTVRLLGETALRAYVPDWVAWRQDDSGQGRFVVDPQAGDLGSYDAIRSYLWAGMLPGADPAAALLRRQIGAMAQATEQADAPPEKVQTRTAVAQGTGPVGFSAALLPLLQVEQRQAALALQQKRVEARLNEPGSKLPYYDLVLSLFGTGWIEKRYQFLPSGRLQLSWEKACPTANAR